MRLLMKYRDWKLRRHVKKYGSKNKGYFNYFNKEWFNKHQKTLLFLLNHRLLKYWFRWILRIHRDVSFKRKINLILPHAYWFDAKYINDGKDIEVKTDFRTHQKFSKRIYYAFRPLWWALHCLDWVIQQTLAPEFSFGFDTLTAYPDANPETTCGDARPSRYSSTGETFSTIRTSTGTGIDDTITAGHIAGLECHSTDTDEYRSLYRGIFLFDTSILGTDINISSAILSLYGQAGTYNNFSSIPDIDIVSSNPANNTSYTVSDYNYTLFGTTVFASMSNTSYDGSGYKSFTLNSDGINNVSKTGISKFGTRVNWDTDNSAPTWGAAKEGVFYGNLADQTGSTSDPKLVVTYTLPSTFVPQVMMI